MATLEQSLTLNDEFTDKLVKLNAVVQQTLQSFEMMNNVLKADYNMTANVDTVGVDDAMTAAARMDNSFSSDYDVEVRVDDREIEEVMRRTRQLTELFDSDIDGFINVDANEVDLAIEKSNVLAEIAESELRANLVVDTPELDGAMLQIERMEDKLNNPMLIDFVISGHPEDQLARFDAELQQIEGAFQRIAATDPSAPVVRMLAPIQQTNTELIQTDVLFDRLASGTDWLLSKMSALPIAGSKFKASMVANIILWSELHVKQSKAYQLMERIRSATSGVNIPQNRLVSTAGKLVTTLFRAHTPMIKFGSLIMKAGLAIGRNIRQQQKMNRQLSIAERSQNRFNQLTRMMQFGIAIAALNQINRIMTGLIGKADKFVNTMSRLNIANDGTQSFEQLSDKILASAYRTRSAYAETADFVAKLAINAGDAFSSNDEAIAFAETLNKAYKIGGASAEEQAGSMQQLVQALGSGVLRGDELNSVMEGAPLIIEAIARELNVTKGEIRELAAEGVITAEIVKNAMLNATDDINEKFATIPMTWSDIVTQMGNVSTYAFRPLIMAFSEFINSGLGQQMIAMMSQAIFAIAEIATWAFTAITAGIQWVMDNINTLAMFFIILGGVIAAVSMATMIYLTMAHWPLVLMILIIIAIINILNAMGISAIQVAAFIAGAIVWVGTVFYDAIIFIIGLFIMFGQTVFNVFAYFWNIVASVVEFFANVWSNPVYSVQMLFYNLISNILGFLAKIADGSGGAGKALGNAFVNGANIAIRAVNKLVELINKIPGINLGHLGELANFDEGYTVGDGIRNIAESFNPGDAPDNYWTAPKMEFSDYTGYEFMANNMVNPNKAASSAYDGVMGLESISLDGLTDFDNMLGKESNAMDNLLSGLAGMPGDYDLDGDDGAGDKLGKGKEIGDIGKIKSEVSIKEDDIKLMRDIAERNFIIKYQQVTPSASVTLNGSGSTEQDAKKLLHVMEKMIEEQKSALLITEPG